MTWWQWLMLGWLTYAALVGGWTTGTWIAQYLINRKERRGYRRTAGDRDDPGTSTGSGLTLWSPSTTTSTISYYTATNTGLINPSGIAVHASPRSWNAPGTNLPTSDGDTPIRAYKVAFVDTLSDGRLSLHSWNLGQPYPIDATASCGESLPHTAPDPTCTCGFYAVDDITKLPTPANEMLILEVELFGKVLVHERGYRAERQRVIRAQIGSCRFCDAPSTHLARITMSGEHSLVCDDHRRHFAYDGPPPFVLADIEAELGIPIGGIF